MCTVTHQHLRTYAIRFSSWAGPYVSHFVKKYLVWAIIAVFSLAILALAVAALGLAVALAAIAAIALAVI